MVFSLESCKISRAFMETLREPKASIQLVGGTWKPPSLQNLRESGFNRLNEFQLRKLKHLLGHDQPEAQQAATEVTEKER